MLHGWESASGGRNGAGAAYAGKVCVISGAGAGLGRHLAMELARAGALLELWDIRADGLDETQSRLPEAATALVDVGDWDAVCAAAEDVMRRRGRVDYVFNNAAVALCGSVLHATPQDFERVLRANLFGAIHGSKAFLPELLRQRSGRIVNVSSVLAQAPLPGLSAYCASKSAVSAFTQCLARECEGSGVAVSLVVPAGIRTDLAANAVIAQAAGPQDLAMLAHIARFLRRDPAKIARRILAGVAAGETRIRTGRDALLIDGFSRLWPETFQRLFLHFLTR